MLGTPCSRRASRPAVVSVGTPSPSRATPTGVLARQLVSVNIPSPSRATPTGETPVGSRQGCLLYDNKKPPPLAHTSRGAATFRISLSRFPRRFARCEMSPLRGLIFARHQNPRLIPVGYVDFAAPRLGWQRDRMIGLGGWTILVEKKRSE